MIGELPTALTVGGQKLPINADFRVMLRIYSALTDDELSPVEKAYVCVRLMYRVEIPVSLFKEAVERAYWFFDGGDMPRSKPTHQRTVDWEQDEQFVMPAVSKSLGVPDIRSLPYLHWWTFLGAFGEIGEGLYSTILGVRSKIASGKKLEPWEREFYRKNRELVVIKKQNAEDEEARRETEEFLKTIT